MSESKIVGSVKWFSNKKGYGFITPSEGSPITEDIFVHQSVILSEGYRTLDEGWEVEFTVGHDDDGKVKAENVTAVGGGPCSGPRSTRRRRNYNKKPAQSTEDEEDIGEEGEEEGAEVVEVEEGNGGRKRAPKPRRRTQGGGRSSKPQQPFWHEVLSGEVKNVLEKKQIRTSTGTIDVATGSSRIKLGTRGYASLVHADRVLVEGTFVCDEAGLTQFEWKHAIKFELEWVPIDDVSFLSTQIRLTDDSVTAVFFDEKPADLWGDELPDPKSALEENGFEMRRVILTTRRR